MNELLEALRDLERTAGQAAEFEDPVRVRARNAITNAANAEPSSASSKTLGNHLCDLLREGECLEIERNFECVSGLSVTAVAANGREATIGIGPERTVRKTDRDRFAEKVHQVLSEARGDLSPID